MALLGRLAPALTLECLLMTSSTGTASWPYSNPRSGKLRALLSIQGRAANAKAIAARQSTACYIGLTYTTADSAVSPTVRQYAHLARSKCQPQLCGKRTTAQQTLAQLLCCHTLTAEIHWPSTIFPATGFGGELRSLRSMV